MSIFTPQNQVKLTNVSVVRLKKAGKRFEIACYKNKVLEWRTGVTKDLDEVVQSDTIFGNVGKGLVAKKDDLQKAFGTTDEREILLLILAKGELQVSEKERTNLLSDLAKEIATLVADLTVHPETKRPYTLSMIEKIMSETIHYSIHPTRSAKQQALDVIRLIREDNTVPIARAQMRVRVTMPAKDGKRIKDKLLSHFTSIDEEEWTNEVEIVGILDPGKYRDLTTLIQAESKGKGVLELLNLKSIADTEEIL